MHIPARSLRAHVDAYLGRSEAGRAMAMEAIEAATAAGESAHLSVAYAALAVVETCAGDLAAAARAYARSREIGAEIGLAHAGAQRACLNEAEVAAAAGRIDQAEAAMVAFDLMSNDASPTWSSGILHRASAAILSAKGDLAAARLELEAALAEPLLQIDRARTLLGLGQVCRRLRERSRAREVLESALDQFTALATPAWIERTRAEIGRISGRRPSDTESLTEAESRIADLVAGGSSNREVAAELFLSVKTVEVTLTHVYQKLGVRSRGQLGARLADPAKH
jgi:DNA-binding CsgD family transcriptional regulator